MSARQNFKPLFARQFPRGGFRMLPLATHIFPTIFHGGNASGYHSRMERASDPDSREMKNHRNCLIILDNSRRPVLVASKASMADLESVFDMIGYMIWIEIWLFRFVKKMKRNRMIITWNVWIKMFEKLRDDLKRKWRMNKKLRFWLLEIFLSLFFFFYFK